MSDLRFLLSQIHRTCSLYPENFLAGYVCSLIEGNPDEEIYKTWIKAREEAEAIKAIHQGQSPERDDRTLDLFATPGDTPLDTPTDGRGVREHEHTDAGVDDSTSGADGLRQGGEHGRVLLRPVRRKGSVGHSHKKPKRPASKDVTDGHT